MAPNEEQALVDSNAPLPPGWEAKLDSSSGKYYYVDHINCKSSWERPKPPKLASYDAPPPLPPPPPSPPSDLPPGQGSAVHSPSGDTYCIDYMNRVSTWKRPSSVAKLAPGGKEEEEHVVDGFDDLSTISGSHGDVKVTPVKKITSTASSTGSNGDSSQETTRTKKAAKKKRQGSGAASVSSVGTSFTAGTTKNHTKNTYVYINGVPIERRKTKFPYPTSPNDPISDDFDNWVTQEGPKQRELAPKGFHAIRKAREKHKSDRKISVENVDVSNVSINGQRLTLSQIRWWAVQWGVRFRSDTNYWYDSKAGFLGKLGGPLKWTVGGLIDVNGKMHPRSSLGDTKIYINNREILENERKNWAMLDMQLIPHTHYIISPKGVVQRVGDNQPLYNWRDKEKAASKKLKAKAKVPGSSHLGIRAIGQATKELARLGLALN